MCNNTKLNINSINPNTHVPFRLLYFLHLGGLHILCEKEKVEGFIEMTTMMTTITSTIAKTFVERDVHKVR